MEVGFRGETYRRKTDGSCSAAELNSPTDTGFNVRPLRFLYQLEVQDTVSDHEETNSEDINSTGDPQRPSKRKATKQDKRFTCGLSDTLLKLRISYFCCGGMLLINFAAGNSPMRTNCRYRTGAFAIT